LKSPDQAGRFVVVIVMLETSDFFEEQIKECNAQAARAVDKSDREFWRHLMWWTAPAPGIEVP
jgi:hypothetical protein